ncbi:uncharacterized protein SPSK_06423 [Sporothrix schenckii 1099-18]|uniref:N-acetyl-D-glucosamine kinase n=2 Tax=Sporothrix schenckii TaxID=29908 RepID=U7PTM4_SPOS1|nr:uncharacterized protein SPSK_06423 [Sporothrix schenckii 1099-18]ERS98104.1 hypothetical protein HMPREF1624_04883 [Sporothrix schenckii ATCC 58251]KJR89811.1 hypothetical protein SPSK_06423 [Sporothrix schenckii 1099-18]
MVSESPQYVLCVDGGGSKCTAVLINSEGTTVVGEAGPCNPSTIGVDAAVAVITEAMNDALSHVPTRAETLAGVQITSAWIGIAGYDRPSLAPVLDAAMVQLLKLPLGPRLRITADIDLLAVNATQWHAPSAVVLVAGTGSVAMSYGRKESETDDDDTVLARTGRVGGWGPLLGDDGAGFSIGRDALRVALRTSDAWTKDGSDDKSIPALSQAVFDYFREQQRVKGTEFQPRDLLSCILTPTPLASTPPSANTSSSPTKTIAQAARIVLSLADTDDQARRILEQGAASLADLVEELLRVQNLDTNTTETALIMAGGLLCHKTYSNMVRNELARRNVQFQWTTQVQSPALEGARFLASQRHRV